MSELRGKLLGIDHGEKIMGLAVCDALQLVARPLQILARSTREKDFAAINALIAAHQIVGVVVGLPDVPEDFDGVSQADTVHNWAARLAGQIEIPVYLWDETLSTFEAEQINDELGLDARTRLDDLAAAVILQSFLESHPPETAFPASVRPRRKAIKGAT